ncbi:unnamed protein product [Macrosiphum euphorbiae]|uniref:Uncharacterized protein n=1 Tax=Macrosiphum euphorbiae TaxID=13131 RepID=A0AAV0W205_9HEMI|nr:unnamed protein product [Macrosiphum euphorbiae]
MGERLKEQMFFAEQECDGSVTVGTNHDPIKLLRRSGALGRATGGVFVVFLFHDDGAVVVIVGGRGRPPDANIATAAAADNDSDFR